MQNADFCSDRQLAQLFGRHTHHAVTADHVFWQPNTNVNTANHGQTAQTATQPYKDLVTVLDLGVNTPTE